MYAILSSAIPTAAALVAGIWLLLEQVSRARLRARLLLLKPEEARIHREHAERVAPAQYDDALSAAREEFDSLLRSHGIRPERLRAPSIREWEVDLAVGNTMPWREVSRQLVLIVGAIGGIVFLGLELARQTGVI